MNAQPSVVSVPQHDPRTRHFVLFLLVIALAVLGGFVTGRMTAPMSARTVHHEGRAFGAAPQAWSVPRITGTGSDLVEMAARSNAVRSAPVTGTGPGLLLVAAFGQGGSK
jgi:hypothetical protein